jgi:hypothetical protein
VDIGRREGSGRIAGFIAAVAVVFLFFVGTIYYKSWLGREDPKGVLIIEGGPEYAGTQVRLTPLGSKPIPGVLTEKDMYRCRFVVDAGIYSLRVWRRDEVFFDLPTFDISELQTAKLTLRPREAPTRPAGR